MKTAVVIPAHNEAGTIADVASRACRQCDWVIVVDDGSDDDTAAQLEGLPVHTLRNESNQGKGASLWRGAIYAIEHGAESIITLDGDGQHDPEEIPRIIEASKRHPGFIVIGTRLSNRNNVPPMRKFANRVANFWISWAAGHPIADSQSGFRLYPAALWQEANPCHDRNHGFVLESELLILGSWLGYYTTPVIVESIYLSGARPSHYRPVTDTWSIVRMVGGKLLSRWMYPLGLLKSLGILPGPVISGKSALRGKRP